MGSEPGEQGPQNRERTVVRPLVHKSVWRIKAGPVGSTEKRMYYWWLNTHTLGRF